MRNGTASGTRTQLLRLERPATQPICLWQHMEMRAGFEPANNRVAACPLEPLGHPIEFGTPDRTRTCGGRIRSPMLYPSELLGHMVRAAGIEPARIAPPGLKSGASASFATPADCLKARLPSGGRRDFPSGSQRGTASSKPQRIACARIVGPAGCNGAIQMGQLPLVPAVGIEPTHPGGYGCLGPARLPVPPHRHMAAFAGLEPATCWLTASRSTN